jgi:GNAT superfamily N-acetyltransferase
LNAVGVLWREVQKKYRAAKRDMVIAQTFGWDENF